MRVVQYLLARAPRVGIALGVLAGLGGLPAHAAVLTLEDVVRGTLKPDNLANRLQEENVKTAAGHLQQAKGAFDWNVNSSLGLQRFYIARAVNGELTNQTQLVNSYYYSASIGRRFRNGVEINPGITAYPGAGATPAQTAGLTQLRPSLGLKIPILRGLGEESADATERSAKDAYYAARQSQVFALAGLVETNVQLFWHCLADDRIAEIAENAARNTDDYQNSLNRQVQRGLIEPTTVQQAAANALQPHLDAEKAEDAARTCRRDLDYATTGSSSEPYPSPSGKLPEIEPFADAVKHLNLNSLTEIALSQRRDLKAAEQNVTAADESLTGAHSASSPQLDLHVDPLSVILSYSQSIQNNTAEGLEAQAASAKRQAELTLRQLQDRTRMDVSDAVRALQLTVSDWQALKEAERQMEGVVQDANKRAKYGSIGWSDFLATENQLAQIQQAVVNAQLQFALGLSSLRFITGTISPETESPAVLASKFATVPAGLN